MRALTFWAWIHTEVLDTTVPWEGHLGAAEAAPHSGLAKPSEGS